MSFKRKLFGKPPMIVGEMSKDMTIKLGYSNERDQFWFQITKYHAEGTKKVRFTDESGKNIEVEKPNPVADEEMRIYVSPQFFKNFTGIAGKMTYNDAYLNKEKIEKDGT